MYKLFKQKLVIARNYTIYKKWDFFAKLNRAQFRINTEAEFVVSIASYPNRAFLLPAVFEALNRQTVVPKKWILVLSEEEWPNCELPSFLKKLCKRGLEIIWVKNNTFAVKKLVPVIEKYPSVSIVTLDDDIIYHPSLLEGLVFRHRKDNDCIVGYIGKALLKKGFELNMYYREKEAANSKTPPEQVYLIGWGGIFYPPNSLDQKALNLEKIQSIVPGRGSDIWFWAAAIAHNTRQICLGLPKAYNLGVPIPQNVDTQPKDRPNTDELLNRFQIAIDFFEIREILITTLPNM